MASNEPIDKPIDKLTGDMKGLVIGASGTIPGYQHGQIKRLVERCGARFATMNMSECTHLVTTENYLKRKSKKINQAQELHDCKIVDMDWLLKKITKHLPESVQKEIMKEKDKDIKAKGKKRERESSLVDDEGSPLKKTKDEEQIKVKFLIELVDEKYPDLNTTLSVWQDDAGLIWDATLVRAGVKKQVEILRLQLLVHRESQKFHTWDLQCQFGSSKSSKSVGDVGTLESAKDTFEEKFKMFSGLAWEDRHGTPTSKGWIFLELHHREVPIFSSEVSSLPASVENVLKIIFATGNLKKYLNVLNSHGRSVSLKKKVDKKKLLVGIAVLGKLMELTNHELAPGKHSQVKERLCKIYGSLIFINRTLSDASDTVRQELESLELLLKLRDASEILERNSQSASLAMSQISHEILGVFRLERPGEAERFAQWEKANLANIGDRRLLWHGSASSNFAGILTQGLRNDGIASLDGKAFIPGVFFADISTKSAGYCRLKGEALMLLCEVELGTSSSLSHHVLGRTIHKKWCDAGYIHPDFKGSMVPDLHAGTMTVNGTPNLYHSEYVAKSPAQIRQRYLFHVKLV
ncbi:hypothetical protein N7517_009813 [Penicillium concentricum]|uniref:Poly [ADP-ribose] polymerase n=1 Tax=Penicillium concentricum TaxID=293559 RepID=A0A9W9RHY7_9EURO|nr:uncharacterized protein N7517_009813 [Penicillium concentricum]KAJ5360622.1 hypothetical protein N7517_009813 [Penicillium concentricum]